MCSWCCSGSSCHDESELECDGGDKETKMSDLFQVSRSNLRQGTVYMLVGLVWGMVIPASPFPRLALGAHIQLTAHGVMFLVAGLVILHLPKATGRLSATILTAGPWLTWPVMLSEMANCVVVHSENASHCRRTSWGSRCGSVARNYCYGRPSDRCGCVDCVLGRNFGRTVS